MTLHTPGDLRSGPFTVEQARQLGVRWKTLQRQEWTRISRGQYVWAALSHDILLRLRAVAERMPVRFAFSGPTGGWLHGVDLPPCDPIEVSIDRNVPIRARANIRVRRTAISETDLVMRRGCPATSAMRTVCDLGSRRDMTASVIAIDLFLHARLVDMASLAKFVDSNPGAKGIRRLRRAIQLADAGAESPMETRLRLALLTAKPKLPRPCCQAELTDRSGHFIARVDLYYPDRRLVIEYDGKNHKERMAEDLRRQNALVNAGYQVLRFTAADLRIAAAQVRQARDMLAKTVR